MLILMLAVCLMVLVLFLAAYMAHRWRTKRGPPPESSAQYVEDSSVLGRWRMWLYLHLDLCIDRIGRTPPPPTSRPSPERMRRKNLIYSVVGPNDPQDPLPSKKLNVLDPLKRFVFDKNPSEANLSASFTTPVFTVTAKNSPVDKTDSKVQTRSVAVRPNFLAMPKRQTASHVRSDVDPGDTNLPTKPPTFIKRVEEWFSKGAFKEVTKTVEVEAGSEEEVCTPHTTEISMDFRPVKEKKLKSFGQASDRLVTEFVALSPVRSPEMHRKITTPPTPRSQRLQSSSTCSTSAASTPGSPPEAFKGRHPLSPLVGRADGRMKCGPPPPPPPNAPHSSRTPTQRFVPQIPSYKPPPPPPSPACKPKCDQPLPPPTNKKPVWPPPAHKPAPPLPPTANKKYQI
jgi:hypothetical protein